MAKKTSNLGKLMDILNISITELSEHLYVDKTTISKWRTGTRRILRRSPYLEPIVDFMIRKNELMEQHPLVYLWEKENSGDYPSSSTLKGFLCEYLCTLPPEDLMDSRIFSSGFPNLSVPEYATFVGVEGRKKAVNLILSIAEEMAVPSTIKIMELEQMDWLCKDMVYLKNIMSRLEKLALKGFQIEFAFSTAYSNASFRTFIMMLDNTRYLKNNKNIFINVDRLVGLIPRIYAIPDLCVAVGLDSMESSVPIHTNFYSDYLNAHKYCLFFDRCVELFGTTSTSSDNCASSNEIFHVISCMPPERQDLFFFGDYLSITTMSEELLMEIMKDNQLSDEETQCCLNYYRLLRRTVEGMHVQYFTTYFNNMQALEDALSHNFIIEYELSTLTGKSIHKSADQYRRHLVEAIQFFESHENVRVVLRYGGYNRLRSYSWLKKNLWSLSLNTQFNPDENMITFFHDPYLLKITEEVCDQSIKAFPVEYSLKQYNLNILETLSRGETHL